MASDIDFNVILAHADGSRPEQAMHILSTHRAGEDDKSQLHLISTERLAELERIETEAAKPSGPPPESA